MRNVNIESSLTLNMVLKGLMLKFLQNIYKHPKCVFPGLTDVCGLQGVEKRIAKANNLMENMSMQHTLWKSELKLAKSKIKTAPGDALLTAACVCYHGPLDNNTRADLMNDWLNRYL